MSIEPVLDANDALSIEDFTVERFLENGQTEYLPWEFARTFLVALGILKRLEAPRVLIDWCAAGKVKARARRLIVDGNIQKLAEIDRDIWKAVVRSPLTAPSFSANFDIDMKDDHGSTRYIKACELEVQKASFVETLNLDDADLVEALKRVRSMVAPVVRRSSLERPHTSSTLPDPSAPKAATRGRKPDLAKRDGIFMAAIELAKADRLTPDGFRSMAELKEEIIEMMGVGAPSSDHFDSCFSQIYQKFCERR